MNSLSLFPRDAIQALLMSVKTISKILLKLNGEKKEEETSAGNEAERYSGVGVT